MPKKSKAKSKAKLNIKKSKKGRRAAPAKRRKLAVSIPMLEAAATKAADFAAKHEAAAAESKGVAEQRRSDADAARQEVAKLETAAKKARHDAAKSAAAVSRTRATRGGGEPDVAQGEERLGRLECPLAGRRADRSTHPRRHGGAGAA